MMADSDQHQFTLDGNRYDLSTYVGRCRHFLEIFNPFLLFTTDAQLNEARSLLNRFKSNEITPTDLSNDRQLNESLWNSKKIIDAIIHPQTDEKIPLPFRMSAFVPMNFPIAVGMLLSQSQAAGLFWQWYNQSYNVAVNFANGNKTNPMPPSKVAKAYTFAVASSCGVHYGLNRILANSTNFGTTMRTFLGRTIPFTAVASAGALNVILMRYNEMSQGIQVCDEDGNEIGISKIAGRRAILQTALSRIVLPVPILLFPPIIMKVKLFWGFFVVLFFCFICANNDCCTVCCFSFLHCCLCFWVLIY